MKALTVGNIKLFRFYFVHWLAPFFHLPRELFDDYALSQRMAKGVAFDLTVSKSFVDGYNNGVAMLGKEVKCLWGSHETPQVEFRTKQILFWMVRLATIAAVFASTQGDPTEQNLMTVWYSSMLQFLVLPYSLFVSITYGLETIFVLYTGHALTFPILMALTEKFLPGKPNELLSITITPRFLIVFLAIDQLLCFVTLFWSPTGAKPEAKSIGRIWQSIWYGFLNCKTYYLVLLPLCFGLKIPIAACFIDYMLGISSSITERTRRYWGVLFYHAHKMGHLPLVYPDAHKFHHYLHDCTSFDAHIFGSGAPEEWLMLLADVLLVKSLGIPPAALSPSVLVVSWFNKWGFHTLVADPIDDGENHHACHHSLHIHNLALTYPYDLIMGTAMKERIKWAGYEIFRTETTGDHDDKMYKLRFIPINTDTSSLIGSKEGGDRPRISKRRNSSTSMTGINFSSTAMMDD